MRKTTIIAILFLLTGCQAIQSFIHDDKVVARVGKHKLYQSEVSAYIPSDVSPADSTNLALQYINSWATDLIFSDMAQTQLSKAERDVTAELEAYKRDLLRFRYEQRFIGDRLDTLVTEDQMLTFYEKHKNLFVLDRPIMKVRFVDIYKNVENKDRIIRLLSSNKPKDMEEVEGLANKYAIRYFDKSYEWMDAAVLAREFGIDYGQMLAKLNQNYIIVQSEEVSDVKAAYVREIRRSGVAPFDFCTERIREYILSGRKHDLLVALEQSLLKGASDDGQFVIY
ncbi:MAG: peptidyl-prolyl cis-trans isomerase [Bacteroidales bacterium]|nr:peptidyl-prolyl cis-trans isomerase [Bacteroidales bacterium]